MQELLFTVFVTGVCFLNCAGSEEYVSELKEPYHQRNTGTHESYYQAGLGTYHNHEGYGPPHHNHNGYQPTVAQPRSYSGSNADSWNDYHAPHRTPPHNWNDPHVYGAPQFPPGFKHSPEFHSRNSGSNDDSRGGRNNLEPKTEEGYANNSIKKIPMDFLQKLDMYEVNDLLINYVDGYDDDDQTPLFTSRFGTDSLERKAVVIPPKAGCSPENTTIPLASSDDPTIFFIPKCTKVERCSGCCSHELLSCQPTEIETTSVQVIKAQYTGGKKLKYVSKELIPLERHIKCKCDCKHCLPHQEYRKNECACVCTNTDEERKCYRDIEKKEWDPETCSCKCRGVLECSTGSIFDHNECRCKTAPKRRYANYEKRGHNPEKLQIVPLE